MEQSWGTKEGCQCKTSMSSSFFFGARNEKISLLDHTQGQSSGLEVFVDSNAARVFRPLDLLPAANLF